jgi:glycosyltransferase involved in cell wall biosynthesis
MKTNGGTMNAQGLSEYLSILIPMFNEEGVIGNTLEKIIKSGLHEHYRIVICDDDSTDESVAEAQSVAKNCSSISVIVNRPNGRKVGAIKTGLRNITTPYVFLLDADTVVNETEAGNFDRLVERMMERDLAVIGFKVQYTSTKLIEHLQRLELLFSDVIRRILNVVICLGGAGILWKVEALKSVIEQHSGCFEGDDLESTMLAAVYNHGRVEYEPNMIVVKSNPMKNLGALLKQRAYVWEAGLVRVFWDLGITRLFVNTKSKWNQGSLHRGFYRSVFITEVLAHPLKIISLGLSVLIFLLSLTSSSDLEQFRDILIKGLNFISFSYGLLWLSSVVSIILLGHSLQHILLCLYFTLYMSGLIIPSLWNGTFQVIGITYLWCYGLCAALIIGVSESAKGKIQWLVCGLLMPFYYTMLLIFPRTFGFAKCISGKIRFKDRR